MTALTTDQKYAELINELKVLNDKFDKFMNGSETDTVPVEGSDNLKSLSGIVADLKRFKYVQKVIDHRLYQDMLDDDIEVGLIVRIWGDSSNVNGLYKKDSTNVFHKISYSDLYDLRDFLPNPWNYVSISKGPSDYNKPVDLLSFKVPNSVFQTNPKRLSGNASFSVDGLGKRGSYSFDFAIDTTTGSGGSNDRKYQVSTSLVTMLALDADFSTYVKPNISVLITPGTLDTTYTISVTDFKAVDGLTNIPASFVINFNGIDKSYKLL